MPKDKSKQRKFLGIIKVRKKTAADVFSAGAGKVRTAIDALPKGSLQARDLIERLDQVGKEAASDARSKKEVKRELAAIHDEARRIAKQAERQEKEMVISRPIPTKETLERQQELYPDLPVAKEKVQAHLGALDDDFFIVDKALGRLHDAMRKLDTELDTPVTKLDTEAAESRKSLRAEINGDIRPIAVEIDADADTLSDQDMQTRLDGLDAVIRVHRGQIKAAQKDLLVKITDLLRNPEDLGTLAETARADQAEVKAAAAYADKRGKIETDLARIEAWGSADAPDLRRRLNSDAPEAPPSYDAATRELDKIATAIAEASKAQETVYSEAAEPLRTRHELVDDKLSRLMITIQMHTNSDWEKAFRKQINTEKKVIETMLANGANTQALKSAEIMIASQEARALDLEGNLEDVILLDEIKWRCEQVLDASESAKRCPDATADMRKTFDARVAEVGKMNPGDAVKAMTKLEGEIRGKPGSLEDMVGKRADWLKEFKAAAKLTDAKIATMLAAMKARLGSGVDKDALDKCHGPIADKLADLRTRSEQEDPTIMAATRSGLDNLNKEIDEAIAALNTGPDIRTADTEAIVQGLFKGEEDGVAREKQRKEDTATYARRRQRFTERYERYKTYDWPASRGEIKAAGNLAKNADDIMKNSYDLDQATRILQSANDRLTKVRRDRQLAARALKDMVKTWTAALSTMDSRIGELHAAAGTTADGSKQDTLKGAAKEVGPTIRTAAEFLKKEAFNDAQKVYAKGDDAKPAELKRTREQTLATIRLYKEFVSNDPIIRAAQANPFGVGGIVSPVYAALRDLEYKVLVNA